MKKRMKKALRKLAEKGYVEAVARMRDIANDRTVSVRERVRAAEFLRATAKRLRRKKK